MRDLTKEEMKSLPGRDPVVRFWHEEGRDHVTWALRSPSNTMRDFHSPHLLMGNWGSEVETDLPVTQIRSSGAKSTPKACTPLPAPQSSPKQHSEMGEGSARLSGEKALRVGNVRN